jgi:hypothetical protein
MQVGIKDFSIHVVKATSQPHKIQEIPFIPPIKVLLELRLLKRAKIDIRKIMTVYIFGGVAVQEVRKGNATDMQRQFPHYGKIDRFYFRGKAEISMQPKCNRLTTFSCILRLFCHFGRFLARARKKP